MPVTAPRRCSTCRQLSVGPCLRCAHVADVRRGSRTARGYDESWQRLRAAHLHIEPHCRSCTAAGRTVRATQVDHVVRFAGLSDPLRLDAGNLQSLCDSCHAKRTRATDADYRAGVSRRGGSVAPNHSRVQFLVGHDARGPGSLG